MGKFHRNHEIREKKKQPYIMTYPVQYLTRKMRSIQLVFIVLYPDNADLKTHVNILPLCSHYQLYY